MTEIAAGSVQSGLWSESAVLELARRFGVSGSVMVRRLNKFDMIASGTYDSLREHFDSFVSSADSADTEGGGNVYSNRIVHIGRYLTELAFRTYAEDRMTATDLSALVNLQVKHLDSLADKMMTGRLSSAGGRVTYSVDTSALVDGWRRWYPPDTHPTLWANIEALAQEGRLFISDMVLEELHERDDDLASWCDARETFLSQPSDDAVQSVLREVINAHSNLGATIPGGKNFADPYVIAAARVRSATVVSHENRSNNLNGPKIPDVCRVYGIEYWRLPDLIRAEGWRILGKPLDDLTETDVQVYVEKQGGRGRTLDYKLVLPGGKDADKKEFLADVTALANAAGGHILFGVEEAGGVAVDVPGVEAPDVDAEILRLDGSIRSGVEPRIPNVGLKAVELANGRHVVVLEVPSSFARPHMVTFRGMNRFFLLGILPARHR